MTPHSLSLYHKKIKEIESVCVTKCIERGGGGGGGGRERERERERLCVNDLEQRLTSLQLIARAYHTHLDSERMIQELSLCVSHF